MWAEQWTFPFSRYVALFKSEHIMIQELKSINGSINRFSWLLVWTSKLWNWTLCFFAGKKKPSTTAPTHEPRGDIAYILVGIVVGPLLLVAISVGLVFAWRSRQNRYVKCFDISYMYETVQPTDLKYLTFTVIVFHCIVTAMASWEIIFVFVNTS